MPLIARRSLLVGLAGAICAPAVVRAGSLMPVAPLRRLGPGAGHTTWTWDGNRWIAVGTAIAIGQAYWTWDGSHWLRSWPTDAAIAAAIASPPALTEAEKMLFAQYTALSRKTFPGRSV